MTRRLITPALLAAYVGTIFAANWFILNVGRCAPGGPCVVPVGFGLVAPSGVLWVGAALALRDALHERGGRRWVFAGVLLGAALSALLSGPLALASGAAFLVSESADWLVYSRVRARGAPLAVLLSGAVGLVVDSILFLWLAFGSLDFLAGQIVGKLWATLAAAALVWLWARRPRSQEPTP